LNIGIGRLDAAADASEHIELPRRIQAEAEEVGRLATA